MSLLDNVKRIIVQDFKKEDQETVAKLAGTLNYFMEQVTNVINGNLDIDNTSSQIVELLVKVDANGTPTKGDKFAANIGHRGSRVVRALNQTDTKVYPTSAPFMTFQGDGTGIYTITNISGLQDGDEYKLLVELIP